MSLLTIQQGEALAEVLLHELTPSVPTKNAIKIRQVNDLLDEPPNRQSKNKSVLTFYESDGRDAPKEVLEDEDIPLYLFCLSHCDFTLNSGTDIDHGTPAAAIYDRQKALLELLNAKDNQEFSNALMEYKEINENQDCISDYFKRDPQDGKIKGTWYFVSTQKSHVPFA